MEKPQYDRSQRLAHWWVALLVPVQYLGQSAMRSAMESADAAKTPALGDFLITTGHSLIGISVLVLVVWRIRLRIRNPVPVAGHVLPAWVAAVARGWHIGLYVTLIVMAVSGILSYYTTFEQADRVHELGKWVLGVLVAGHVLAGLAHWLVVKDQVLQGMSVRRRDADTISSSGQSPD